MSDTNVTVELLKSTALFGALGVAEREAVAQRMRPHVFPSGTLIFGRGDPGRELYLIEKGRVRLSVVTQEGRELSFHQAGPGEVFGEIAVLDRGTRTADAAAVGPVNVMVLSEPDFRRLCVQHPMLSELALRLVCQRLRDADMQLEAVALHRIEVRLARFLVGLARQANGGSGGRASFELGMSQGDLALLLGASRPKVNAALMLLEDEGAIERDDTRISCHMDALIALAELE